MKTVATAAHWALTAAALGRRHAEQAEQSAEHGHFVTARDRHLRASDCLRAAYHALPEDDSRRDDWHREQRAQFARAGELGDPRAEPLRADAAAGSSGWLLRPPDAVTPPVVIILGDVSDCAEDHHTVARYLLERALAAVLLDHPDHASPTRATDSGLTRIDAFTAVVDQLAAHRRLRPSIGLWGIGGDSAPLIQAAARDPRISVCRLPTDPQPRRCLHDARSMNADWFSDRLYDCAH